MDELAPLHSLAHSMGVQTTFVDGLHRQVEVAPETLVQVCASLGAPIIRPEEASAALLAHERARSDRFIPPVLVAWDGTLTPLRFAGDHPLEAELTLEDGTDFPLAVLRSELKLEGTLPMGYHRLTVACGDRSADSTIIAAPERSWRSAESDRSWGLGTHLAALRSSRSRSLGDLADLEFLCRWVGARGGDLVTVLPLLPTFNGPPPEPSPYSPVSRLFWSELILDLGSAHRPTDSPERLDVSRADAEVRAALEGRGAPDASKLDPELLRYARFRGAQGRLGRDWRQWPEPARSGALTPRDIDTAEERFHLLAQTRVREQLDRLGAKLDEWGVRLGLDLAVGVHPDGYDPWSRQQLFANGMSVGAPPDPGFPSGQDWGFSPVLPDASREEGHRYLAASVAHQARAAGVLRVDHIMAMTRLYWIPHGAGLHEGTYVAYPAEELFAILTLESHRNRCEIVGENLGTVPPEIDEALPRHRIRGMFLAQFAAYAEEPTPPGPAEVALIGTHDTPTLAGWIDEVDIDERIRTGLLEAEAAPAEREARAKAALRLAATLDGDVERRRDLLQRLLEWLGASPSPLVIPWIEDLWLEGEQVNLPGTRSSERPNWQRPMARLLDEALADPHVEALVRHLGEVRRDRPSEPAEPHTPAPGSS